jgi:uncharacterized protein (DUF1800 family)
MSHAPSRRAFLRSSCRGQVFASPPPTLSAGFDIGASRRLLNRGAFGPSFSDLADVAALGPDAWIDAQIDWVSLDDSAFENIHAPFVGSLPNYKILRNSFIHRALFSKRQLQARMSHFWESHFNTDLSKTGRSREQAEYAEFLRLATSPFAEVLRASAQSPAMIIYLDNDSNRANATNENYARELLELHTMGVNGGYSETDIAELARVFTGWRHRHVGDGRRVFDFNPNHHDSGPKTVLGWTTSGIAGAAGVEEGLSFLGYLAALPETRAYVGEKLTRNFVADPPVALLNEVAALIGSPKKGIERALRVILQHVAADPGASRDKSMDPLEWCLGAARRLGDSSPNIDTLRNSIEAMGLLLFRFPVPTGQPESGPKWESPSQLLQRWEVADRIDDGSYNGISPDWTAVLGNPAPLTATALLDRLILVLLDGDLQAQPRAVLARWLAKTLPANPSAVQVAAMAPTLAGVILRLPESNLN